MSSAPLSTAWNTLQLATPCSFARNGWSPSSFLDKKGKEHERELVSPAPVPPKSVFKQERRFVDRVPAQALMCRWCHRKLRIMFTQALMQGWFEFSPRAVLATSNSDSRRAKQAIIVRYDVLRKCGTYVDQVTISDMPADSDRKPMNISATSIRRAQRYMREIIAITYVRTP